MEHADVVYKMFQVNCVLQVTFLAVTNSDHFHNYPLDHFGVDGVPDKPSLKQYWYFFQKKNHPLFQYNFECKNDQVLNIWTGD